VILALVHFLLALVTALTILGLPLAKKHFQFGKMILHPFNVDYCEGHYSGPHEVEVPYDDHHDHDHHDHHHDKHHHEHHEHHDKQGYHSI